MFDRLYGLITKARNSLYETGVFKSFTLGVPTVSVGNITVGGTGKTPLVAFITQILAETGEKVCVLSRGYGRDNSKQRVLVSDGKKILTDVRESGDEPFELAQKLLGKAIVVVDANRAAAGNWARERFGITAFVLDDAFQHRRVRRDVNIVAIDATNPFGNEKLLPAGILREPLENLKRADAIVITRANLTKNVADLKAQISEYNSHCPIFVSKNRALGLINLENFSAKTSTDANYELRITSQRPKTKDRRTTERCFAFCALGNPRNFFEQLRKENFNLASTEEFPDHHFYTQKDIEKLQTKARKANAEVLLTTAKDAVKLKNLEFDLPCFVVASEMVFDAENDFRDWLILRIKAAA
jgi:tetraacyldisaccharide 4'-kinase